MAANGFFDLKTPLDMLEKAKRELARFEETASVDHVFNFLISANHLRDFAGCDPKIPDAALKAFMGEPDIQLCAALANKAKHFKLRLKPGRPDPDTFHFDHTLSGGMALSGGMKLSTGHEWLLVTAPGVEQEFRPLAHRIVASWVRFLGKHS